MGDVNKPESDDLRAAGRGNLWVEVEGRGYFLVPAGVALPAGSLRIRALAGEVREVDPGALAPFAASDDELRAWADRELVRVLRALARLPQGSNPVAEAPARPGHPSPAAPATPGLDLLAAITNTPRAELDTGAPGAALKRYFGDIGATVADAVSGDPARIARSKERMAEWSATLRAHGTEVGEPQPAAGRAPETGAAAGEAPEGAATEPPQSPGTTDASGFPARLRELAEQFRRRADALAAARLDGPTTPAAPEAGPGDAPSPAEAGQPTSAAETKRAAAEGQAQPMPSSSNAAPAADQPKPSSRAEAQAAALEALAAGLEDAAGDAAARLRAHASRLRRGS